MPREALTLNQKGELKLDAQTTYLEHGTAWNTSNNYSKGWGFSKWASTIDGVSLALSMELPYSNHLGQKVTPQNARLLGKDLAIALVSYLKKL